MPKEERQKILQNYGFTCDCFACLADPELEVSPTNDVNKKTSEESSTRSSPSENVIKSIQENWREMEKSYDQGRTQNFLQRSFNNYVILTTLAYFSSWPSFPET